ncbi:FAD-dependent oxidoreductase [Clostridium sp. CF011]|uniref:FAD-dependent oxidoreductase n=1 Tax=Clostridium sp. CF011 TaxID=2843318 RepID=UPI001C0BF851|nr:FAD-dependent oxidoreductase [Clostridium sp. CF011]MBU3092323.1 FAD-dependent oxidoreductase [Clostridium sp. CF011]WAG71419.1 FAD-dependent oxidoreductase [Clostridium sp. CF011]
MVTINYNNKDIELIESYDCCVVGGGTAGAIAGISSSKLGLKTLVIERYSILGGTSTAGLVTPMMPSYVDEMDISKEVNEELKKYGDCIYSPEYEELKDYSGEERPEEAIALTWFNPDKLAVVLERTLIKYNGHLLYDATLCDVIKENNKIKYIIIMTSDGLKGIESKCFVDGTGDAILSRLSGVMVDKGDSNNENQPVSLRFELGGIDLEKFYDFMISLGDDYCRSRLPHYTFMVTHQGRTQVLEPIMKKALENGDITKDEYIWLQGFTIPSKDSHMAFNCPRVPTNRNSTDIFVKSNAYVVGREMIDRYYGFMKKYVDGFKNSYISKVAIQLGVRESYRIKGRETLTFKDYIERRKSEDGLVKGDWWIDIHKDKHDEADEHNLKFKEYYEIPYGAMVTNEVSNLIVVGRCISSEFRAQASLRIQHQCRSMGEVAGYACKYSIDNNVALNIVQGKEIKRFIVRKEW